MAIDIDQIDDFLQDLDRSEGKDTRGADRKKTKIKIKMMKKKFDGTLIKDQFNGDDVTLLDISSSGVKLETEHALFLNNVYYFETIADQPKLKFGAKVVYCNKREQLFTYGCKFEEIIK